MGHFFFFPRGNRYITFKAKSLTIVSEIILHVMTCSESIRVGQERECILVAYLHIIFPKHLPMFGNVIDKTKNRPFVAVGSFMSFLLTCSPAGSDRGGFQYWCVSSNSQLPAMLCLVVHLLIVLSV